MKIHQKQSKQQTNSSWGYWGDYGEIGIGLSSGKIDYPSDSFEKLHYHKDGTVYFLTTHGEGLMEINGEKIPMQKDVVIQVDPEEKYRIIQAVKYPFTWITICTTKDPADKVIVE